jgi:hypothetical protein
LFALCVGDCSWAATVTRQVYVLFNGSLPGGNTYTLGAGELDVTNSFRKNGTATMAGGVADIPGDMDASSGFLFDGAALGALTTQSWVTEAIVAPDVAVADQPNNPQPFNHFLDVQGDLFFRFNGNGAPMKITQFGYWDGAAEPTITTPDPPANRFTHVALTWNAGSNTLEAFIDGVSQGTVSTGSPFATPSTNVGYGFFSRTGFLNRAIDGKLAGVAFSKFTGTFNPGFGPGFDFQLDPTDVPDLVLSLKVNTVSGNVSIVNNTLAPVSIRGYEVTSAAGSLDVGPGGWLSLSDQNIDPVMGGDDVGETWDEAGNPTMHGILEGFLLGSSTLAPGASLSLGRAFNEVLNVRDLQFSYLLASPGGVVNGSVVYDSTPPPSLNGDYNNNGAVDAADYVVWRKNLGAAVTLPNDPTPGMVTPADYNVWRANFGKSVGTGAAPVAAAVPEPPTDLVLLSIGTAMFVVPPLGGRLPAKARTTNDPS